MPKETFLQRQAFTFFRDFSTFGGFLFYLLALLVALISQQFNLFLRLLLGLVLIMLVSVLIRVFYFKHRPKKQAYKSFIERIDASAFPSIHTARFIFLSLVFISFFKNSLVTAFFLLLMALVPYSRVYLKKHDWQDLLGGLVLAILVFWLTSFF